MMLPAGESRLHYKPGELNVEDVLDARSVLGI